MDAGSVVGGSEKEICYAIVQNIPKIYHACDLRNFFSQFLETGGFSCFHFRHRPEIQRPIVNSIESNKDVSRCVTTCCVIKVLKHRMIELIEMYHRKHWVDRGGHTLLTRCFIKRVDVRDNEDAGNSEAKRYKTNAELREISPDREIFTKADLASLIEMKPPILMPNGNVGTPTTFFLAQIKACRLPPSVITKLKLEFPKSLAKRLYGNVDYDYPGRREKSRPSDDLKFVKTHTGTIISDTYAEPKEKDDRLTDDEESRKEEDEESEEEEWDRYETLHDDVTGQERLKERLFEEKIELKWEKGGSGLVFYTDAQIWDQMEGDFDAKTADDWDIDTSAYYEPGAGDKDARDFLKMRLEERLRSGNHSEKIDMEDFAAFEKYSKGFARKLMESQGWKQGEGIGKTSGRSEPVPQIGQNPRDKKGFGYRGEKLKRIIGPQSRRKKRRCKNYDDDDEDIFQISTIYDNPLETDPPEPLLQSSVLTRLKYRQEFLRGTDSPS